ncbi:MAG: ABC transporter ATP-binding protein [Dehalococcoidia bacterium]|nr:ABC transporter ATP-binding protein [Dehalococcoidia bacterium]
MEDLSFEVAHREVFAILGPSGCGKTTTLRLIAGFERPDSGEILLGGQPVASSTQWVPPERRGVGIVFQDYALFPHLSVAQNVAFGLRSLPAAQRTKIVKNMLEMVGMGEYARRYPHELSGGQQQRVALARSLAPCPVVLLLDEPFSNLDADMRTQMRQEVQNILGEAETTTILVTHDQEEAFILADRVALLNCGRMEQVGTPEEIYHHPASRFVASFVGEADLLEGIIVEGAVETEVGRFAYAGPIPSNTPVFVMLRPDDVDLLPDREAEAVIAQRHFRGSENLYTVRLPSGQVLHSSQTSTVIMPLGQAVRVEASPAHIVAFERGAEDR